MLSCEASPDYIDTVEEVQISRPRPMISSTRSRERVAFEVFVGGAFSKR